MHGLLKPGLFRHATATNKTRLLPATWRVAVPTYILSHPSRFNTIALTTFFLPFLVKIVQGKMLTYLGNGFNQFCSGNNYGNADAPISLLLDIMLGQMSVKSLLHTPQPMERTALSGSRSESYRKCLRASAYESPQT